jgi:hypothetical protein
MDQRPRCRTASTTGKITEWAIQTSLDTGNWDQTVVVGHHMLDLYSVKVLAPSRAFSNREGKAK